MTTAKTKNSVRKDPVLAAVLSLIVVGSGHIYLGDAGKGIALFATACILGLIFLPLALFPALYAVYDAYHIAKASGEDLDEQQRIAEEKLIKTDEFVASIRKLDSLFQAGVMSEEELRERKLQVFNQLHFKTPVDDPLDFLAALVPLKQSGLLSGDDLTKIKALLG